MMLLLFCYVILLMRNVSTIYVVGNLLCVLPFANSILRCTQLIYIFDIYKAFFKEQTCLYISQYTSNYWRLKQSKHNFWEAYFFKETTLCCLNFFCTWIFYDLVPLCLQCDCKQSQKLWRRSSNFQFERRWWYNESSFQVCVINIMSPTYHFDYKFT